MQTLKQINYDIQLLCNSIKFIDNHKKELEAELDQLLLEKCKLLVETEIKINL